MKSYIVKNLNGETFEVDENKISEAEKDGFLPVVTNGTKEFRVESKNLKAAKLDGFTPLQNISNAESFARGAIQAGSLGFADEIEAGARSLMQNKPYETTRNEIRAQYKQAEMQNPKSYLGGNVTGGIATAFIPGMNVAKGVSIGKAAMQGAALGAANALGSSDAENLSMDQIKDIGAGGAIGLGFSALGQSVGKLTGSSKDISKVAQKANKETIIESAKRLGINVTPGMLDDTGYLERLEYTLANSPSLMGQSINKKQRQVVDKLKDGVSAALKDASNIDKYQTGEQFKSSFIANIGEKLDPISALYDDITESTKHIPISKKAKNAIIRNIENMDEYSITGGEGKPSQYVNYISNLKNAKQVKSLMTMLNRDIKDAQGAEKYTLLGIKEKLERLEASSIKRAAIELNEAGIHKTTADNVGKNLLQDLNEANKAYSQLRTDMRSVAKDARLKDNYGPNFVLNQIEQIPSENIQRRFFNTNNLRQLKNLKETFPEQFELLRRGEIQKIVEKSTNNTLNGQGDISAQRFLNEIRKLGPEAKEVIFKNPELLNDIEIIQKAMPRNFNPSGTAGQLGWQDIVYSNVRDIPAYAQYTIANSKTGKKLAEKISNENFRSGSKALNQGISQSITSGLVNKNNNERSDVNQKWLSNGLNSLININPNLDQEIIDYLIDTKQGQSILLEADVYKDNPERLKQISNKILQLKNEVK